ncbi:MAG: ferritin [Candidatus Eisenbacteria bacterium]|nr:ferritin [Candidatus Eisenbacteria bacterium]
MGSEGLHENREALKKETIDLHRAITSLVEELEAVDWYNQRVDVAADPELGRILAHNRDEEKEHAAMLMEWIRRHDEAFAHEMKDYLFTDDPITEIEEG